MRKAKLRLIVSAVLITVGCGRNLDEANVTDTIPKDQSQQELDNVVAPAPKTSVSTFIVTPTIRPDAITIGPNGNFYAVRGREIYMVTKGGRSKLIATASYTYSDGYALSGLNGIALDNIGNIYSTDLYQNKIIKFTPAGKVSVLAGGDYGYKDGSAKTASFNHPTNIAIDAKGNLYVADSGNGFIRKLSPSGTVTTLAGKDGIHKFSHPNAVAIDKLGNVYVADGAAENEGQIYKIEASGALMILTDKNKWVRKEGDPQHNANFSKPMGITADEVGNVYVADRGNSSIVKVTPKGDTTVLTGGGSGYYDGPGHLAKFIAPTGLIVNEEGQILVADSDNGIRLITQQ